MIKRGGALNGRRDDIRGRNNEPPRALEPLPELVRGDAENIPEEVRRKLAKMADHLAPYESFADTVELSNPADRVALFEVLEDAGVVDASFIKMIRAIGKEVSAFAVARDEKCWKGKRWRVQESNAAISRSDAEFGEIMRRAQLERRPLFVFFATETVHNAYVFSVMEKIRFFERRASGFVEAMADTEESGRTGMDPARQATVTDWFRFVQSFSKQKRSIPPPEFAPGVTSAQAFQELKLVSFEEAVGSQKRKVVLPGIRWRDADVLCEVSVSKNQSPFIVCELTLVDSRGVHIANGYLSRITGEVAVSGSMTVSAQEIFSFFQADEKYQGLKEHVLAAVHKLWKEKNLQEEATVDVNMADEDNEEEPGMDVSGAPSRTFTREEGMRAFYEQFGNQDAKKPAKEHRGEEGELSRFGWRRVMEAFKRCGVTVELDHDHPKLFYNGEVTKYINRHERDPRRNRAVVNRVLRELGIPRDEFKKKLW